MNNGLPEVDFDQRERELPACPAQAPVPARGQRRPPDPRTRKRRVHRSRVNVLPLILSAAALIIAIAALVLALRGNREPSPSPDLPDEDGPVTFQFGSMTLTPLEGMPLNAYDRAAFSVNEKGRVTYEKDGRRSKAGIDVSSHQQDIDWQAVAADGIDFVILRLGRRGYTEGGLFLDDAFERNLQGALDAGLEAGVYFFSQAITPKEAEEEADYILDVLSGRELAYPIAFDWESIPDDDARTDGLDGETMTRCAAAFCKRIEDAGYRPAVYFNQTQGYLHYDLRELTDYKLWLAEYDTVPDFYYSFDLWQYSHTGQVDGIQGNVDLDLAF